MPVRRLQGHPDMGAEDRRQSSGFRRASAQADAQYRQAGPVYSKASWICSSMVSGSAGTDPGLSGSGAPSVRGSASGVSTGASGGPGDSGGGPSSCYGSGCSMFAPF